MSENLYDVIIIGSGPAGLTAAIYTTRANLKTLIIAGSKWGGQLMLTSIVENFPGFPDGIYGPDLMINIRRQAEKFGAEIVEENFTSGDFSSHPFKVTAGNNTYESKSIIIATGADTKWLGLPGEKEKIGKGISSCAPCDAVFFKERNVIVVGGGDSAMEEAIFLTKFAKSATVVHRRDQFRASKIMLDRAKSNQKISFLLNSEIVEIIGEGKVEKVKIKSPFSVIPNSFRDLPANSEMLKQVQHDNQEIITWEMPIDGVFVAIGHTPNAGVFKRIDIDSEGYIVVHDHTKTNIEGVFVAGDVHDSHYQQAITAAGFGCAAALEVEHWLASRES